MSILVPLRKAAKKCANYSRWPGSYPFRMSREEKKLFCKKIQSSTSYLEFGLGGSTICALQNSSAKIHSVESSYEWIASMRRYSAVRNSENNRLFIHHVEIGPTLEWGYPASSDHKNLFPSYSSSIFSQIEKDTIDLVLIDGRFRVACILMTILECHANRNLQIVIHDFLNRKEYHLVLKYLDINERIDTLGIFSIKENIDLGSVKSDYEEYMYNPA